MRKAPITPIIIVILLVTLLACSRNDEPPVNPEPPGNNGVNLARVYFLDTTLAHPYDTLGKFFVQYDAQMRPSVMVSINFEPSGDSSFLDVQRYEYIGTDSMATRLISYTKKFGSSENYDFDTTFLQYLNGRRIFDSTYTRSVNGSQSQSYSTAFRYTYNPGGMRVTRNLYSSFIEDVIETNVYQTYNSGDLTYQLDTSMWKSGPMSPIRYTRREILTNYLTGLNPFYRVMKPGIRHHFGDDIGMGSFGITPHLYSQRIFNEKTWQEGQPVNNNSHQINYSFTLRADGYPLRGKQIQNGSTYIMVFQYQ